MNKDFAWFLGFLASDGSIVRPTYRSKGDESHLIFCIKNTDIKVLEKVKNILQTNANIREYPNYKSPQAQLNVYDRKDIIEQYGDIKRKVPEDVLRYERHYMRGLVDGDGCLNYRSDRKSFRINIINQERDIVDWFGKTLHEKLNVSHKEPRFKPQDNLWILEWEGKVARLIAWYLYHGDIQSSVLDRKLKYYQEYLLGDSKDYTYHEELIKAANLKLINNHLLMVTNSQDTLRWCHIIQKLLMVKSTPIPVNKGKTKYYELYLPMANMQDMT